MDRQYIDPMFRSLIARACARLPGRCAVCARWPAQPLCEDCIAGFAQPVARCGGCAIALPEGVEGRCGACLLHRPPLDACFAAVSYRFPWAGCIARFKYRGEAAWAGPFALLLRSAPWVEPALEAADWVVPMPLSRERLRERGFNQAHELARRIAPGKARADLLLRVRHAQPQRGLDRATRERNVEGAFALSAGAAGEVRGRRIVLVDDVMTSCASLHAAALTLRGAGAAEVTGLVLARAEAPAE